MLKQRLVKVPVRYFDELGIPSEAREAVYFAVLGNEFIFGNRSNLPNVTGARRKVILGTLVPGD